MQANVGPAVGADEQIQLAIAIDIDQRHPDGLPQDRQLRAGQEGAVALAGTQADRVVDVVGDGKVRDLVAVEVADRYVLGRGLHIDVGRRRPQEAAIAVAQANGDLVSLVEDDRQVRLGVAVEVRVKNFLIFVEGELN